MTFQDFFFNLLKKLSSRAFVCRLFHLATATRFRVRQGGGIRPLPPPPPSGVRSAKYPSGARISACRVFLCRLLSTCVVCLLCDTNLRVSALLLFLLRSSPPLTVFAWFEEQSAGGRSLSGPGDRRDPHLVPLIVVQVLQGPHQTLLRRTLKPTLRTDTRHINSSLSIYINCPRDTASLCCNIRIGLHPLDRNAYASINYCHPTMFWE